MEYFREGFMELFMECFRERNFLSFRWRYRNDTDHFREVTKMDTKKRPQIGPLLRICDESCLVFV